MKVFIVLVLVSSLVGCSKQLQPITEKKDTSYKGKYLGVLLELKDCEENYNSLWNASFNNSSENIWDDVKFIPGNTALKTDTPVANPTKNTPVVEPTTTKWKPKTPVESRIQKELETPCEPKIIYLPGEPVEVEKTPVSVVIALIVMGLTILALIIALIKKPAKFL